MENNLEKLAGIRKSIEKFTQKYILFFKKEEPLIVESGIGQAMLTDYEALFKGSEGGGIININGNYYNTIYCENLNLGNSLPEF